jgi:hypothetical protein
MKNNEQVFDQEDLNKIYDEIDQIKEEEEELESGNDNEDSQKESSELPDEDNSEDELINTNGIELLSDDTDLVKLEKPSKKNSVWQLKKAKYQARAENAKLREEIAELKNQLNRSVDTGLYHYSKKAELELAQANQRLRNAVENADVEAYNNAVNDVIAATIDLKEAQKININSDPQQQNNFEHDAQAEYVELQKEIFTDWMEGHPDLNKSSRHFNNDIYDKVDRFIVKLNNHLVQNNQQNIYLTDKYFQTVDNYIAQLKKNSVRRSENIQNASRIGSVRNSYSNNIRKTPQEEKLSRDEIELMQKFGMTKDQWIAAKRKNNRIERS